MRAVVAVPSERAIRVEQRAPAEVRGPGGVLLRVLEVGLCGTDREIASFAYGTPPSGRDRLVLGHECLAEVAEAGPGVERLRPGDLVVPMVRRPCDAASCAACRAGRQDFCYTGRFTECGIS